MAAQVKAKRTRERRAGDDRRFASFTATYQLSSNAEGPNLRVLGSQVALTLEPDQMLPRSDFSDLLAQMTALTPDFIISPGGEFLGIHDLPEYRSRVQGLLSRMIPNDLAPDLMPNIKRALASEGTLMANASDLWNGLVGSWLEAELDVGAKYQHSQRLPHPIVPGESVLTHYEFVVDRVFPCERGSLGTTCAVIHMHAKSDPSDSQRVMKTFIDRLAAGSTEEKPVFQELHTENVVKLVTEPSTLIPHSYEDTQIMRGTVLLHGKSQPLHQAETSQFTFSY